MKLSLESARARLDRVDLLNRGAEADIDEGFFVLEEIAGSDRADRSVAENLGRTYMARFHARAREILSGGEAPEPALEALLRAVGALENTEFAEGLDIESLRIEVASKLMDSYFRGYSASEKSEAIAGLMARLGEDNLENND